VAFLTGEQKKPLRLVCRQACAAVDAGITWIKQNTFDDSEVTGWFPPQPSPPDLAPRRLPALRHLSMRVPYPAWTASQGDAAAAGGAARALEAHVPALRGLHLLMRDSQTDSQGEEKARMGALLAAPMPALERLDVFLPSRYNDEIDRQRLELLRPLSRLAAPRLARATLVTDGFRDGRALAQMLRWLGGAQLPALRHLGLVCSTEGDSSACLTPLAAPRWAALESLDLMARSVDELPPAVSRTLAPNLRSFTGFVWPFGGARSAPEWPNLRRLVVDNNMDPPLAQQLGGARLPRLETLYTAVLSGLAALRPAMPALRAVGSESWGSYDQWRSIYRNLGPEREAVLEELRQAWPALELGAVAREEPDPLRRPGDPEEMMFYDPGVQYE
jgi:hypothetical protein